MVRITALVGMVIAVVATNPGRAQEQPVAEKDSANELVALSPQPPDFATQISERLQDHSRSAKGEVERDYLALIAFYEARQHEPIWLRDSELTSRAQALISEIKNADAWGLKAKAFKLPLVDSAGHLKAKDLKARAKAEIEISIAALAYARHARGGRIMQPSKTLSSHIDRKPKVIKRNLILASIANSAQPDAYLRTLHNTHRQFARLRFAYLAKRKAGGRIRLGDQEILKPGDTHKIVKRLRARLGLRSNYPSEDRDLDVFDDVLVDELRTFQEAFGITPADGNLDKKTLRILNKRHSVSAERLAANMEQWRWMWNNMGDLYVLANVPEFMLHVYKFGERIHSERIVAGEIGRQTSIFSRPLRDITFRPMWRVPESIKVYELWPNLRRGGSMFRRYGLKLETKDGKRLNYRKIDWWKNDIRNYEVVQPPGRKSVMGVVKFSFPSQHTIFMHDTPDKYMFKHRQRTLSHGCLRVRKPVKLAEILLAEDKGWSAQKIKQLIRSGPNSNQIMIDREIPIHIVYFTAWVDKTGNAKAYRDVYGHEKRIRLALRGKWKSIKKGRDHLAPVKPSFSKKHRVAKKRRKRNRTPSDHVNAALGTLF